MNKIEYAYVDDEKRIDTEFIVYRIGPYRVNWHKYIELLIVLKGKMDLYSGGKKYSLEEDDVFLIESHPGHATLAKSPDTIVLLVHISPDIFQELDWEGDGHRMPNKVRNYDKYNPVFVELRQIAATYIQRCIFDTPTNTFIKEGMIKILAGLIYDAFPAKVLAKSRTSKKDKNDEIFPIIDYINANYQKKINLEEIASLYGYSTNYMSLFFKSQVGINFHEYLSRVRLREATFGLNRSDRQISEIALEHGFPDVKSFNYNFKKYFNKTPSQYRQELSTSTIEKIKELGRDYIFATNQEILKKLKDLGNCSSDGKPQIPGGYDLKDILAVATTVRDNLAEKTDALSQIIEKLSSSDLEKES